MFPVTFYYCVGSSYFRYSGPFSVLLLHFTPHLISSLYAFRIITLIITDLFPFVCLPQIAASLEKNLIPRLNNSPPDIEALRLYLTLPECPLFTNRNNYVTISIPFAKSVISLKEAPLKVLGR